MDVACHGPPVPHIVALPSRCFASCNLNINRCRKTALLKYYTVEWSEYSMRGTKDFGFSLIFMYFVYFLHDLIHVRGRKIMFFSSTWNHLYFSSFQIVFTSILELISRKVYGDSNTFILNTLSYRFIFDIIDQHHIKHR